MRFRLPHLLLYATLFAVILGGGVVYGLVSDRWAPSAEDSRPLLQNLPLTIGDWDGSVMEINPDEIPVAAFDTMGIAATSIGSMGPL